MIISLVILLLVTLTVKYHLSRWDLYKIANKMSGPLALPIIGSSWLFAGKTEDVFNKLQKLLHKYEHPIKIWMGPFLLTFFSDVKHVEVLMLSTKLTSKSSLYAFLKDGGFGDGLISSSGKKWRDHRKIIQPLITNKLFANAVPLMHKHINIMAERMQKSLNMGVIDIMDYIHRCCFDIVADTVNGFDCGTQTGRNLAALHGFEDFHDNVFGQMVKPWLYPKCIFNATSYRTERDRILTDVYNVLFQMIDNSRARVEKQSAEETGPLIDLITRQLIKHPDAMTRDDLRDHAFTLFIASEETVALTTAMVCRCMGMYPDYQEKAAEEIRDVFGDAPRQVLLEDLPKLKYLEMCIKDVLRLQTIAPFILRKTTENIVVGEYNIPAGVDVVIPIFYIHRNPEQWQEPLHFYPDHFLPEAVAKRNTFSYMPFSAGPRVCIGKNFAMQMLKVLMANILQHFRFEASGKFTDINFRSDISVRPLDGFHVKVFQRTWK